MEALYAKLYSKYEALKKKRISELDEINKDQEVNFLNYVSAAEELIQHMKNENERLSTQVSDLRSQIASARSTKDDECARYQKLLMEEKQKNKMLSEELENLQKLQEQHYSSPNHAKTNEKQLRMLQTGQVTSGEVTTGSTRIMTRKRSREAGTEREGLISPERSNQDDVSVRKSSKDSSMVRKHNQEAETERPACCGRAALGAVIDNGSTSCRYQELIECLLGMKLSTISQTEGICISALHQSSGYTFSLTWVKKDAGENELLYRVSTLGTFEMVAPEWMRSVLMFSTSMFPIFLERVARVIKMHH